MPDNYIITLKRHADIMENDEDIGYGELDDKVAQPPSLEEVEETEKVFDYFMELAEDDEIDWKQLKMILELALKSELHHRRGSVPNNKKEINGVNAAPPAIPQTQTQVTGDSNGILTTLLSIVCGSLCKDTPFAEIIPAPVQSSPVSAMFSELSLEGFSKDICRSMVAMLDEDRSGRLGYREFKQLWSSIRTWKNAWIMYDTDRSGTFNGFELREALNSAGYRLNNRILNILMHRYGNKRAEIHFDDFMMCAIKLKTMIDIFNEKSVRGTDFASFTMEEWLESTLYS